MSQITIGAKFLFASLTPILQNVLKYISMSCFSTLHVALPIVNKLWTLEVLHVC